MHQANDTVPGAAGSPGSGASWARKPGLRGLGAGAHPLPSYLPGLGVTSYLGAVRPPDPETKCLRLQHKKALRGTINQVLKMSPASRTRFQSQVDSRGRESTWRQASQQQVLRAG